MATSALDVASCVVKQPTKGDWFFFAKDCIVVAFKLFVMLSAFGERAFSGVHVTHALGLWGQDNAPVLQAWFDFLIFVVGGCGVVGFGFAKYALKRDQKRLKSAVYWWRMLILPYSPLVFYPERIATWINPAMWVAISRKCAQTRVGVTWDEVPAENRPRRNRLCVMSMLLYVPLLLMLALTATTLFIAKLVSMANILSAVRDSASMRDLSYAQLTDLGLIVLDFLAIAALGNRPIVEELHAVQAHHATGLGRINAAFIVPDITFAQGVWWMYGAKKWEHMALVHRRTHQIAAEHRSRSPGGEA